MKNYMLLLLFLGAGITWGQNCSPFTSTEAGNVKITISPETGNCFTVTIDGRKVVSENASEATFYLNYGIYKAEVLLDNGTVIKKSIYPAEKDALIAYKIKQNKKGKYIMKMKLGEYELSTQGKADRDADMKRMEDERIARQEASDKEWEEKKAAREAEREKERAKEKAEEEQRDTERKARWDAQRKEEDANRVTMEDQIAEKKAEEERKRQEAEAKRQEAEAERQRAQAEREAAQNARIAEQNARIDQKNAEIEESKAQMEQSAASSGSSSSSVDISGSGVPMKFELYYKEKPVCAWDVEISHKARDEDRDIVVASGRTDNNGAFKSKYAGMIGQPFKVAGKRKGPNGDVNWSVSGFWYISQEEVKAGVVKMDIAKYEDYMSDGGGMGMGGMAISFAGYGLTSKCE